MATKAQSVLVYPINACAGVGCDSRLSPLTTAVSYVDPSGMFNGSTC